MRKSHAVTNIRNVLDYTTLSAAKFFWSSIVSDLQWEKACTTLNKYCINNKVKEVNFKILHRIYPAKEVLQRFKHNIDYNCVLQFRKRNYIPSFLPL